MIGGRIVVAMSGGVDSSVAAALLVEAGHEVVGVTLRLRDCRAGADEPSCCGADGEGQARAVAGRLGFPHFIVDCREVFRETVLRRAWDEYDRGRTPNPCVLCNRDVKFGLLLDRARALGAEAVATGHYVRVEAGADGAPMLLRGRDPGKDQSYFLFALGADALRAACFPLGGMTKTEVRDRAAALGLSNARRPDSQDACLVSEGGFAEALRREFDAPSRPGRVLGPEGEVVAGHRGLHRFTIGQRRGTGLALGRRAWVRSLDAGTGDVSLTDDPEDLGSDAIRVRDLVLHRATADTFRCTVQIRYRSPAVAAEVVLRGGGSADVRFDSPVRAAAPGQAAVFYDGEAVLGGGWID